MNPYATQELLDFIILFECKTYSMQLKTFAQLQTGKIYSEIKPNFYKPPKAKLIKATQLFERISLNFKGPLPFSTKNDYKLTVVDDFSRFPFAFLC